MWFVTDFVSYFQVNNVHDYRKGNRARQLSTVKFELFTFPFSVFVYFRLIQLAKYLLTYDSNGVVTNRSEKVICAFCKRSLKKNSLCNQLLPTFF